jgi:hypothetical protein
LTGAGGVGGADAGVGWWVVLPGVRAVDRQQPADDDDDSAVGGEEGAPAEHDDDDDGLLVGPPQHCWQHAGRRLEQCAAAAAVGPAIENDAAAVWAAL